MRKIFAFLIVFSVFSATFADNIDGFLNIEFGSSKEYIASRLTDLGFVEDRVTYENEENYIKYYKPKTSFSYLHQEVSFIAIIFEHGKFVAGGVTFINPKEFDMDYICYKFPDIRYLEDQSNDENVMYIYMDIKTNNFMRVKIFQSNNNIIATIMFDQTE